MFCLQWHPAVSPIVLMFVVQMAGTACVPQVTTFSFLQYLADTAGGSTWSELCYNCTFGISCLVPMLGQPGGHPAVSSSGLPSQWL